MSHKGAQLKRKRRNSMKRWYRKQLEHLAARVTRYLKGE